MEQTKNNIITIKQTKDDMAVIEPITITTVRSDTIYQKIMEAPLNHKDDIYRYELMKPFEQKLAMYHCPLKAKEPGGYDAIMASGMMGYLLPTKIDASKEESITLLKDDIFWEQCRTSIEKVLKCFTDSGVELPVKEYVFSILLADPESPYSIMNDNYCGDGGIPGYILGSLVPSDYTKSRLPVALAHETNHNVRFQFEKWRNDISLGAYMVCEGLAENFATYLYGEDKVGPWVSKTDMQTLNEYIKPLMREALDAQGFDNITSYMYGDEMAKMRDFIPVGMPYCAGYACGYHLVKYYLKKTGKSIIEATLTSSLEILEDAQGFWDEVSE